MARFLRHGVYLLQIKAASADVMRVMNTGELLTMQSENQVHVLSAGDSLVLDCDFHADHYNLFDYPVLWRKSQAGKERYYKANENNNNYNITLNTDRST